MELEILKTLAKHQEKNIFLSDSHEKLCRYIARESESVVASVE